MIAFVKGTLFAAATHQVVIDLNGLGYEIAIPVHLFSRLPAIGREVLLHTAFIVREQSHALYGFLTPQERDLFNLLLGVTGVGPKLALAMVGHLSPNELQAAVQKKDLTTICRVPGIGKKTAERLIIEIKDKLSPLLFLEPTAMSASAHIGISVHTTTARDALNALINLGYTQLNAQKAIQKTLSEVQEELDLPSLISASLQRM